jgi:hypothetical protein
MNNQVIEIELDSILINNINNVNYCYCCREETTSTSPCVCKTALCDSCLTTYINYNTKCTICNTELLVDIVEYSDSELSEESNDTLLPSPTGNIDRGLTFSLSYEDNDTNIKVDFIFILKIVCGILCVFYLLFLFNNVGYIGNNLLMNYSTSLRLDPQIILLGFVYVFGTFLIGLMLSFIISFILIILQCIWYYISCKPLRNYI